MAVLVVRSTGPRSPSLRHAGVAGPRLGRPARGRAGPNVGGGDNGLLLLVALEDRRMHLLVGYGLEGVLPDGRVGGILDRHVTPAFRERDYGRGVYDGLRAAAEVVAQEAGVELSGAPARPSRPPGASIELGILRASLILIALSMSGDGGPPGAAPAPPRLLGRRLRRLGRRGRGGRLGGGGFAEAGLGAAFGGGAASRRRRGRSW
jgi:uncharacterized protein